MIRTQISLTDRQMERLRREAKRRDVSIAAVVREAVDRFVPDEDERRVELHGRFMSVAGAFTDAASVAERHDEHLGEALEDEADRWRTG